MMNQTFQSDNDSINLSAFNNFIAALRHLDLHDPDEVADFYELIMPLFTNIEGVCRKQWGMMSAKKLGLAEFSEMTAAVFSLIANESDLEKAERLDELFYRIQRTRRDDSVNSSHIASLSNALAAAEKIKNELSELIEALSNSNQRIKGTIQEKLVKDILYIVSTYKFINPKNPIEALTRVLTSLTIDDHVITALNNLIAAQDTEKADLELFLQACEQVKSQKKVEYKHNELIEKVRTIAGYLLQPSQKSAADTSVIQKLFLNQNVRKAVEKLYFTGDKLALENEFNKNDITAILSMDVIESLQAKAKEQLYQQLIVEFDNALSNMKRLLNEIAAINDKLNPARNSLFADDDIDRPQLMKDKQENICELMQYMAKLQQCAKTLYIKKMSIAARDEFTEIVKNSYQVIKYYNPKNKALKTAFTSKRDEVFSGQNQLGSFVDERISAFILDNIEILEQEKLLQRAWTTCTDQCKIAIAKSNNSGVIPETSKQVIKVNKCYKEAMDQTLEQAKTSILTKRLDKSQLATALKVHSKQMQEVPDSGGAVRQFKEKVARGLESLVKKTTGKDISLTWRGAAKKLVDTADTLTAAASA